MLIRPKPDWKGTVDIIIGTHALLGKAFSSSAGLLIIDEEQHFGKVAHKEKFETT